MKMFAQANYCKKALVNYQSLVVNDDLLVKIISSIHSNKIYTSFTIHIDQTLLLSSHYKKTSTSFLR